MLLYEKQITQAPFVWVTIASGSGVADELSAVITGVWSNTVVVFTPVKPIAIPVVSVSAWVSPLIVTEPSGVAPITLYQTPIDACCPTLPTKGVITSVHPEETIAGVPAVTVLGAATQAITTSFCCKDIPERLTVTSPPLFANDLATEPLIVIAMFQFL